MKLPPSLPLVLGLAAGIVVLAGLAWLAFGLLAPAAAPAASAFPAASECGPDQSACPVYPLPDPAQALPTGLETWTMTAKVALPAGSAATILASGPQGLVALGGQTLLFLEPGPAGKAGKLALRASRALDFDATALAVAPDGRIFLSDGLRVRSLTATGEALGQWELPAGSAPVPCLAAGKDRLYVACSQPKAVLVYTLDGEREGRLEARPDQDFLVPGTHFPLTATSDGATAVNPGRRGLQFFTSLGQQTAGWARSGPDWADFQGCCNPITIAALPVAGGEDRIVTAEKGMARVKIVDRTGRLWAVLERPGDFLANTQDIGLAVDALGRINILDSDRQEIRIHER